MLSLFGGFVHVDDQLRMLLDELNTKFMTDFKAYYSTLVSETLESWYEHFEDKCPQTTERFATEYEADSTDFFTRVFECTRRGLGPAQESVESLFKEYREFQRDLHVLTGSEDYISIDHHIMAKNVLVDLYQATKQNTQVLEKVVDDNDGAAVAYTKITVDKSD